MSIVLSFGKYGGFYYESGVDGSKMRRLCLGWFAIIIIFEDFDPWIEKILEGIDDIHKRLD